MNTTETQRSIKEKIEEYEKKERKTWYKWTTKRNKYIVSIITVNTCNAYRWNFWHRVWVRCRFPGSHFQLNLLHESTVGHPVLQLLVFSNYRKMGCERSNVRSEVRINFTRVVSRVSYCEGWVSCTRMWRVLALNWRYFECFHVMRMKRDVTRSTSTYKRWAEERIHEKKRSEEVRRKEERW
jgi:hypothetical protein